jgi:N-acetylglucosaminyldiphosphoundecaprenol N-acetyl-beta-D-mannosaminyltransferase
MRVDNVTCSDVLDRIRRLLRGRGQHHIVTPNAHHVLLFQKDPVFREVYARAAMALPDGISMVLASKVLGGPLQGRCCGADVFLNICRLCHQLKKRVFLLGGSPGSEGRAEAKLLRLFPGMAVSSYSPPFGFDENEAQTRRAIEAVRRFRTDVLVVGVGAPKSENWVYRERERLGFKLALMLGSALGYFVGSQRRAPLWMRRLGLEWLFRLVLEPRRLWKRYILGNPAFLLLVAKERFRGKAASPTVDSSPDRAGA